jgi:prepilin-type N-terminal cleavage/methylation domain-containing protein
MNFFTDRAKRRLRGFTLVELLIVIVIIGVMAALIGPTFTTGSDIARVKTASRGVIQMSRYARTMALLHQTPVELVYTSDGTLRVEQVAGGGEGIVSAKAFGVTNSADLAAEPAAAESEPAPAAAGAPAESGGSSYVMADLNLTTQFEGVVFLFKGYTDSFETGRGSKVGKARAVLDEPEEESEKGKEDVKAFRVRYKSNGTCRPYSVRVTPRGEEGFAVTVVIDVLGAAKVEEEDE